MQFEHKCRDCGYEWLEEYTLAELEDGMDFYCPDCDSEDTYRCVTTSAAIIFKGPGWSPQGYSKSAPLEKLAKQLPIKEFGSKEDHDRVMRGEAMEAEKKRLKRESEIAKKTLGPDAAVTEREAEKRIKKAARKALGGSDD